MTPNRDLVCDVLRQPQQMARLSLPDWDLLVRQARRAGLLARIASMLEAQGSIDALPDAPRVHLKAAMTLAAAQHAVVLRELWLIDQALAHADVRPVLLNGAAYVAGGLLPAMGRMLSSIDILVPEERLIEVDDALRDCDWVTPFHSVHGQNHSRQWTRERPPLRHIRLQDVLGVQHATLPLTARVTRCSASLLVNSRALQNLPRFGILDPVDMVLHSMAQLFRNDDLNHSLRDLSDLDLLLRYFGRVPAFWTKLLDRAREIDLVRPLHYGLRFAHRLLATPVPSPHLESARAGGPNRAVEYLSDWLWTRALRPRHSTASDRWTPFALFALQVRSLSLRKPPLLRLRRLLRVEGSAGQTCVRAR